MNISPNNNINFEALRLVNANNPKKIHLALNMLSEMVPGYKPFLVSEALDSSYRPTGKQGGFYIGNKINPDEIDNYLKLGEKTILFDEDFQGILGGDTDSKFNNILTNPISMTIGQLKKLYRSFKAQEKTIVKDQKQLKRDQNLFNESKKYIYEYFGIIK